MFNWKKTKREALDDQFDLDSDLDLGAFDFDASPLEDDRKPTAKMATGFWSGLTTGLKDSSFIRKTLKDVLPRGFGETIDFGDKLAQNARSLYDESAQEIKPAIKDFKRAATKLIDPQSKLVPKAIATLLQRWETEQSESEALSPSTQREQFLSLQLAELFKAQAQVQAQSEAKDEAQAHVQQGLDLQRHRDLFGVLSESQNHLKRIDQYQSTVTLGVQKKTLELQYRQLFALQDLVTQGNKGFALQSEAFSKLVKNTAYPDYLKLTGPELAGDVTKRRFIESASKSLFGKQIDFIERSLTQVRDKIGEKIKTATADFRTALFGAEMAKELSEGGLIDRHELGGNVAGGLAAQGLGTLGGKWLREKLVDRSPRLQKAGTRLESFVENIPRKLNTFKKDSRYAFETGPLAWTLRQLQELLPSATPETQFNRITFRQLEQPYHFTRRTDKSITEIIPGYLSRILREIQVFRTGNEAIELTQFDYTQDRFTSKSKLGSRLLKTVIKPEAVQQTRAELQQLLQTVDPDNTLSESAQRALQQRLLENSTQMAEATPKNLAQAYLYQGPGAQEAAQYMESYLNGLTPDQRLQFEKRHNRLSESIHDPRGVMETLINLGYADRLKQTGLLDKTGRFLDTDKLLQFYLGEREAGVRPDHPKPAARPKATGSQVRMDATSSLPQVTDIAPMEPVSAKPSSGFSERDQYRQDLQALLERQLGGIDTHLQAALQQHRRGNQHLQTIEELIKAGMTLTVRRQSGSAPGPGFNFERFNYDKFKEFFKRWRTEKPESNSALGTDGPNFGEGLPGRFAQFAYRSAQLGGGLVQGVAKRFTQSAKFNFELLKHLGDQTTSRTLFRIKDVYVEGEEKPRLYAARIRAGVYFKQKDQRPLKSHVELDGPIVDRDGNVIIAEEDLDKLYTKDLFGRLKKLIRTGLRSAGNAGKGLFGLYAKYTPKLLSMEWNLVKKLGQGMQSTLKSAWNLLDQPIDLYSPGQDVPVLLATVMKNGGYFSKLSKKPITRPGEIDGPVIDLDGNEVLSLDMLRKGLYTAQGTKVQLPMAKILGALKSGLGALWRVQQGAWKLTGKLTKGLFNAGRNLLNGFSLEINSQKSVTVLEEIRDLLKVQFKKVTGDASGDGLRDGSWQELKRQREAAKQARQAAKPGQPVSTASAGKSGGMWEGLKGLSEKISGLMGGMGSLLGGLKGLGARILGLGGILGKVIAALGSSKLLGTLGSAAGGLFGKVGTAARAGLALLPGLGGLAAGGAASTAAASAGSALGAGAASTGLLGGLGATLGTVGAGILSFVSSPVVLGVAATAALGYGGYKLYQHLKNKLEPLDSIRLVQYGFQAEDQARFKQILQLETYLKDFTSISPQGMLIREKDLDMRKLLGSFDLDASNEDDLVRFFKWYQNRFKPVYLTHCAAVVLIKQMKNLHILDKLKPAEQVKYIELVKFPEGPYQYRQLPIELEDYPVSDAAVVKQTIAAVIKELGLEKVKPSSTSLTKIGIADPSSTDPIQADRAGFNPKLKLQEQPASENALPAVKMGLSYSAVSKVDLRQFQPSGVVTALDAIRLRCYGLKDLGLAKLEAIKFLEKTITPQLKYQAGTVTWDGNLIQVFEKVKGGFGIFEDVGREANAWRQWFTQRFLPVFLDYVTLYTSYTGRREYDDQTQLLKPAQQLQLAKLLAGIPGIWSLTASPFPKYTLNTDSESIQANLRFLEETAKQVQLQEERKALPAKQETAIKPISVQKPNTESGLLKAKTAVSDASVSPDQERAPQSSGTITPVQSGSNPSGLKLAGGPLMDGRNALNHLNLSNGVRLENMNPALMAQFYGMVEEYGQLTGKKITVTDGFRSYAQQAAMKQKYGARAASPGSSLHEFGLALDVDSKDLNALDELGLMRKYGFMRPVGKEPWHLEPAGIQLNISKYKQDAEAAMQAIEEGVGRGGGGQGTLVDAPAYSRNIALTEKILTAQMSPNVNLQKPESVQANLVRNEASPEGMSSASLPTQGGILKTRLEPFPAPSNTRETLSAAAVSAPDAEAKPTGLQQVQTKLDQASANSALGGFKADLPASPERTIPTPSGDVESVKETVIEAAKMVGVDPNIAVSTVAVESGFNPKAQASTSSASGLYQFIQRTWNETVSKHGSKYGLTPATADPLDAKTNAIMGAHYLKDNVQLLNNKIERDVGPTEMYLAHFLGPAGASKFIQSLDQAPDQPAAAVMPQAAQSNRAIFYDQGQARSTAQVYDLLEHRVKTKAQRFGIQLAESSQDWRQAGPMSRAPQTSDWESSESPRLTRVPRIPRPGMNPLETSFQSPTEAGQRTPMPRRPVQASSVQFADLGRSPMNDAYGFNPSRIQPASSAENTQRNLIDANLFKTTETLLGQSVELEGQMLTVLKDIFGLMSARQTEREQAQQQEDKLKKNPIIGGGQRPNLMSSNQAVSAVPVSMRKAI